MKAGRREFLKKTMNASLFYSGAPMINSIFEPDFSRAKYKLKLFTFIPSQFPLWGQALKKTAEDLYHETDGRFAMSIHNLYEESESQLRQENFLDNLFENEYDVCHIMPATLSHINPVFSLFSHIPINLNSKSINDWVMYSYKSGISEKAFSVAGLKHFPFGIIDAPGLWLKKEVQDISDLQKMNIRCLGLTQSILKEVGGKPCLSDLENLKEQILVGKIDGFEGVSNFIDTERGFHELGLQYYQGSWPKSAYAMGLIFKKSTWENIDPKTQVIFDRVVVKNHKLLTQQTLKYDRMSLENIKDASKVKQIPEAVTGPLRDATERLFSHLSGTNALFREVYNELQLFSRS